MRAYIVLINFLWLIGCASGDGAERGSYQNSAGEVSIDVRKDMDEFTGVESCSVVRVVSDAYSSDLVGSNVGFPVHCYHEEYLVYSDSYKVDGDIYIGYGVRNGDFACARVLGGSSSLERSGYWVFDSARGETLDPNVLYTLSPRARHVRPKPFTFFGVREFKLFMDISDQDNIHVRLGEAGAPRYSVRRELIEVLFENCIPPDR